MFNYVSFDYTLKIFTASETKGVVVVEWSMLQGTQLFWWGCLVQRAEMIG